MPDVRFALCLALGLVVGCGSTHAGPDDDPSPDADGGAGLLTEDEDPGSRDRREAFCEGSGPPVSVGDGSVERTTCAGALAEQVFRYALCTCEGVHVATSDFRTESFDSRDDEDPRFSGAPVGINHELHAAGEIQIGGTLQVASADALSLTGQHAVRGDLRVGGRLSVFGGLEVARDAEVDGDVVGVPQIDIARDLHLSGSATGVQVGGETLQGAVSVAEPCACAPDELLDVAAYVDAALGDHDNAHIGLDPASLVGVRGARRLTLPCGRFVLDGVSGVGNVTLDIQGRVALFVAGDLEVTGGLSVELAEGAELDLFIAGNLRMVGGAQLGSVDRPAGVRVYVAGDQRISLVGAQALGGNLYAPRAPVELAGQAGVRGSLFVASLEAAGQATIVYDRAILDAGEDCDDPTPPACESCDDCGGNACDEGMCVGCASDADCCGPLVCYENGECGALLY